MTLLSCHSVQWRSLVASSAMYFLQWRGGRQRSRALTRPPPQQLCAQCRWCCWRTRAHASTQVPVLTVTAELQYKHQPCSLTLMLIPAADAARHLHCGTMWLGCRLAAYFLSGIVLSVAPLMGADPVIDPSHKRWLHVHVRPPVRGLLKVHTCIF
jgi:hypothetical protein